MRTRQYVRLYDLSAVLLAALVLLGVWLYAGPPEEARQRQQAFTRGVDTMLGGMGAPQVVMQYGGIDEEPEINARVAAIFERVVPQAAADRDDLRYQISVLKSDIPNAFSLPGGRTFITRGLVELLDNDDEIAGVLGHELAHTVRSHGSTAFGRDLGMILFYDFVLDRVDPSQAEEAAQLAQLTHALVSTGYSRAAETEADTIGLRYAVGAGYAPLGLPNALLKIEEYQRQNKDPRAEEIPVYFRTHPMTEDRVRHLRAEAKAMGFDVCVPGDPVTEALKRMEGVECKE